MVPESNVKARMTNMPVICKANVRVLDTSATCHTDIATTAAAAC